LTVLQVTPGGGAEEAGVQPGDVIIAVDGTDITAMTTDAVSVMIKGDEGTKVAIRVKRGTQTLEFSVTRKTIKTEVATATMLEGNIGLVRIVNFDSRCAEETIAAIESLLEQGAQKLIFDVRYNPGGYKNELVKILDYLLPQGLLFRSEYYDGTVTDDNSDAKCLKMPMVVLVNGSSYSAAEFFAAALRDYEWAGVVGTQTCGKGYFQNTFQLQDGSAVALSTGKYYTPKLISLAEVGGLTPDRVVEVTQEQDSAIYMGTLLPEEDPQILAAIEMLNAK
jgi:carboxyl-terminal processing protease